MTPQEAKQNLERIWKDYTSAYDTISEDDVTAFDMAIEALEKQIPTEPMVRIGVYNKNIWHLYCPTCGSWVGMHNRRLKGTRMHNNTNSEICAKCGQMLELEFEEANNDE